MSVEQIPPATTPISGSVTANAGTNLNTSALALEAGHLATIDTSTAASAAVEGTTAGVAVTTDATGTIQQYLRGLIKLLITAGSALVTSRTQDGSGNSIGSTSNALDVNIKSGNPTTIAVTQGTSPWVVGQSTAASLNATVSIAAAQTLATVTTVTAVTAITNQVDTNLKQVGGANTVTGGLAGSQAVGGTQANNASITANPTLIGCEARQDQGGTNATAGNIIRPIADRYGRLITISPKLTHADSNGTAITTATTTTVIAAPSASTHLKIYRIQAANSSATATWVYWQDHTSGSVNYYPAYLPQNGIVSLNVNGEWELASAKALDLKTSAAGNIEWHVVYETVAD